MSLVKENVRSVVTGSQEVEESIPSMTNLRPEDLRGENSSGELPSVVTIRDCLLDRSPSLHKEFSPTTAHSEEKGINS